MVGISRFDRHRKIRLLGLPFVRDGMFRRIKEQFKHRNLGVA
jgi:hypothetical protein